MHAWGPSSVLHDTHLVGRMGLALDSWACSLMFAPHMPPQNKWAQPVYKKCREHLDKILPHTGGCREDALGSVTWSTTSFLSERIGLSVRGVSAKDRSHLAFTFCLDLQLILSWAKVELICVHSFWFVIGNSQMEANARHRSYLFTGPPALKSVWAVDKCRALKLLKFQLNVHHIADGFLVLRS